MVVVNLLDDGVGDTFGSVSATSDVHTSLDGRAKSPCRVPAVALCRVGLRFSSVGSPRRRTPFSVYASVRSCTIEIYMKLTTLESALGQKQAFAVHTDVRFTPKSGHVQCTR